MTWLVYYEIMASQFLNRVSAHLSEPHHIWIKILREWLLLNYLMYVIGRILLSSCAEGWSTSSISAYSILIKYDVVSLCFRFFKRNVPLNILIVTITATIIQESLEFLPVEVVAAHRNFWYRAHVGVLSDLHLILLVPWLSFILSRDSIAL